MIPTTTRLVYDQEQEIFRDQVRRFLDRELYPNLDRWEKEGIVDRKFWLASGAAGLLCPQVPEEYGGLGLDFRYNAIIDEEIGYANSAVGLPLQSDIAGVYHINFCGEIIAAIAMTEPGAGSDLQGIRATARREGDSYVVNGSKTYITNGQNAD